jgi:hypothetical protein
MTSTGDIRKSTDGGVTWMAVGTISQVNMRAMTLDDGDLVAASKEGLISSSNDATSWNWVGSINQLNVVSIGNDTPQATGIPGNSPSAAPRLRITNVWPNPFNLSQPINVAFELPQATQVSFELYDVAGKLVARRASESLASSGAYDRSWQVRGIPSGTYFLRVSTTSGLEARAKIVVVR